MFAFQDKRGAVELAFTDRFGGMSAGPFAELNLALPPESEDVAPHEERLETIEANWDTVTRAMLGGPQPAPREPGPRSTGPVPGLRGVVSMRQVHGAEVAVVGGPTQAPAVDALVTADPGWLLASRAADCVPVLLADPERGVVAAVHAGRAGLATNVVGNALAAMADLGALEVVAWIGPHACGRCYEVPEAMRDEVAALVPEARSETSWGTPAIDLGAGVASQLRSSGAVREVVDVDRCTIEDRAFYSYRRAGELSGRHAGLIWIRP